MNRGLPTAAYSVAPIKRMSILERRPGDERAFFLKHWQEIHGGMVSAMPYLYAYQQNHVLDAFDCGGDALPADGFVEQLWRSTYEMQQGYNSPAVRIMIADEPNYLGHGSNYALLATGPLRHAPDGDKLICSVRHGGDVALADRIAGAARDLVGDEAIVREDVIATIAKPNLLPAPPRPVDMFLHLHCADAAAAGRAGRSLARVIADMELREPGAAAVHRVATVIIVAAA